MRIKIKYINIVSSSDIQIDEIEVPKEYIQMAINLDSSLGSQSTVKVYKEGESYTIISLPGESVMLPKKEEVPF